MILAKNSKFEIHVGAPTVNDDVGTGFSVGDRWLDRVAEKEYVLMDTTAGAAVWTDLSLSPAESVTLDELSDVGITAPAEDEVLAFDDGSGDWINQTPVEAGLADAAQGALADSALQAELNDLSSVVTWDDIPDANVPESAVTQHEAALAVTISQITDYSGDLGEFAVASLPTASANANAFALATNASGGRTLVRSDGTVWKVVVVEGATVSV